MGFLGTSRHKVGRHRTNPTFGTRHKKDRSQERSFSFFESRRRARPARRRLPRSPGYRPPAWRPVPLRYSFQRTRKKYKIAADAPWQYGKSTATTAEPINARTASSAVSDRRVAKCSSGQLTSMATDATV